MSMFFYLFFFFQAEDGIRDHCVTGVQTCALPISRVRLLELRRLERLHARLDPSVSLRQIRDRPLRGRLAAGARRRSDEDRKSTRLNSSHTVISYAVFCLKKKKVVRPSTLREDTGV